MPWGAPMTAFWGKCSQQDIGAQAHPLVDHCLDVAMVLRRLVTVSNIARRLRATTSTPLKDTTLDRLAAIAFLHDVGKCNWGFQAKRDPGARETTGHVMEAAALLWDAETRELWPEAWRELIGEVCAWFVDGERQAVSMLLAAISHHGRPVSHNDFKANRGGSIARWWRPRSGVVPAQGLEQLAQVVRSTFPAAFVADKALIDANPAFQQRFAGLVMLADWIGSDTRFFPYRQDDEEDRVALACRQADRALTAIGIEVPELRHPRPFVERHPFAPTPLQDLLDWELPAEEASRLVLVESDTGSGKTEAALAWFLRLYSLGLVDGMYFALPTRVAAREIYGRVTTIIDASFPDIAMRPGPVLLAAPGYVRVDGAAPILSDPDGHLWEDDVIARRQERQWAAAHPKRFLAAPVAVGTIDQALLSVLKVKHALLRSACLDRSLLVVDEVHASDPYMRETLKELLRGHIARGGWALLLSATLGEVACNALFGRDMQSLEEAQRRPYPSISRPAGERFVPGTYRPKVVTTDILDSLLDSDLLPHIVHAVQAGARVLVVCNTVSRAIALQRAVEADGRISREAMFAVNGTICPHHGRFARDDREILDAEVTRRLGKGSSDGALLLIGTQTLEQSLDIDADWLVSDPCPMDVLLQRIGRLHRHSGTRVRPKEFNKPRVLLRAPPRLDLVPFLRSDGLLRGPAGLGTVYADGRVLQRTLEIVRDKSPWNLPSDNRTLVELATHPEALATLGEPWIAHGHHIEGRELADVRAAITSTLDDRTPFGQLQYRAPEEHVVTRLGAGHVDLPLAQPMSQPFGNMVRSIGIPSHLAPALQTLPERIEATACDDGFRFALCNRRFRYTRFGLELDDA